MFIKHRILLSLVALLLLSACASILEGSTQEVRVEILGAAGGYCLLERPGSLYKIYPPQTIRLTNNADDLTVNCTMPGNRKKTIVVAAQPSYTSFLNITNGFLPGMMYDYSSGAMFKYPNIIAVDFTDVPSSVRSLPDYQRLLLENPRLAEVEEFRSGASALQRDRDWPIQTLQKRAVLPGRKVEEVTISSFAAVPVSGDSWVAEPYRMVIGTTDDSAAALTQQMNPHVFNASASSGTESSGSDASGIPEPLYPSY